MMFTYLANRAQAIDRRVVRSIAVQRSPQTDRALRNLSRLANHGGLWFGVAAALAVTGGSSRRGAVRGLLALAGASSSANGILKPMLPRARPDVDMVPYARRLLSPPISSSFPSGHAASAAAFVTGVALESPIAGAALIPLGAAVAYSRVHIGVHWPSDVLAGAALGGAIALSTRRWWAVRVDEPAALGTDVRSPALARGARLSIVVNKGSGSCDDAMIDKIVRLLPEADILYPPEDADWSEWFDAEIDKSNPRALGVCGGDGTVVMVAEASVRRGLPLAVFPGGTLNHFARDAGVSDIDETAAAIDSGHAISVDMAHVDVDADRRKSFLNTASLGGYPDSVRIREKLEPRWGKWPAAAVAMVRVLAAAEPLHLDLNGHRESVWMLFVGNGRYMPRDQVPMSRSDIGSRLLDVRYLRAGIHMSRTRLVAAALTGTLGRSRAYAQLSIGELDIEIAGRKVGLATDGEVVGDGRNFVFTSAPASLTLYRCQRA